MHGAKLVNILVCLLLSSYVAGCSTMLGTEQLRIPNVHIAYATYLDHPELADVPDMCQYQIDHVVKGHFITNDYVFVSFRKQTLPKNGLPQHAILILHLGSDENAWYDDASEIARSDPAPLGLRCYTAYRGDAGMGILEDTAENRRFANSVSLRLLSETPEDDRLPKAKALEIAVASITSDERFSSVKVEASVKREPYRWAVFCEILQSDGTQYIGDHCIIWVDDDGKVVDVHGGR